MLEEQENIEEPLEEWFTTKLDEIFLPVENMFYSKCYFEVFAKGIDDETKTIDYIFVLN